MKNFLVNIWAYDRHGRFNVTSEDNAEALEKAILDKLGQNVIVWEKTGMFSRLNRITYEEVINGGDNATSGDPLHTKEGTRSSMGAGAS
jgi:hypothetical protein